MNSKVFIQKIINALCITRKNRWYFVPHENGRNDLYDLKNFSGDNILTFINYLLGKKFNHKVDIYIECYSEKRIAELENYISSFKNENLSVTLLPSQTTVESGTNKKRLIKNHIKKYTCSLWFTDTIYAFSNDNLKTQKAICLNYSTPFKSNKISDSYKEHKGLSCFLETSLFTSKVDSADYNQPLFKFPVLGFPRNDNLIKNANTAVADWVKSNLDFTPKKIIVYAPTYRDYEGAYHNKCILGYSDETKKLDEFLRVNNYVLIAKMHPLQEIDDIAYSKNIIKYEKSYDYSLYDLLAISDMLVSDYSSVIHDYLLTDKPVILNWFDIEMYDNTRGFAFEPIKEFCPGAIVTSLDGFTKMVDDVFCNTYHDDKYELIKKMFHRYYDEKSSERVYEYLVKTGAIDE